MSSAINQIFDNNPIVGAAMDVAKMAFPQLAVADSIANVAIGALGGAVNGAMDALCKEHGMPNFLGDLVKNVVNNVLPQFMNPVSQDCCDAVADKLGSKIDDFKKEMMQGIIDDVLKGKDGADEEAAAKGGSAGGKSWFVALMTALGDLQNKQADKLQKLSKDVSESMQSDGNNGPAFDLMEEFKAESKLMEALSNVVKTVGDAIGNSLKTVARPQ